MTDTLTGFALLQSAVTETTQQQVLPSSQLDALIT